jgi:hypothetical protein
VVTLRRSSSGRKTTADEAGDATLSTLPRVAVTSTASLTRNGSSGGCVVPVSLDGGEDGWGCCAWTPTAPMLSTMASDATPRVNESRERMTPILIESHRLPGRIPNRWLPKTVEWTRRSVDEAPPVHQKPTAISARGLRMSSR